jgi:hypothetical protein
MKSFFQKFSSLQDKRITSLKQEGDCLILAFSDGSTIEAGYWRLNGGSSKLSSFDHGLKYGLSSPIDAIEELRKYLTDKVVINGVVEVETGDLIFHFENSLWLQIFNFTGNEAWEVTFSDGSGQLSNYFQK